MPTQAWAWHPEKEVLIMNNENRLTPAEMELEAALGGLQPVAVAIERDRLMYRAGQSSARRRNLAWPILSIALSLLLGVSLLHQPESQVQTVEREKLVYITKPAPRTQPALQMAAQTGLPDPYQVQAQANYVKLRDKVLTEGLDVLPKRRGRSANAARERGEDYLTIRKSSWW
jgi:hypothetical protein